MEGYFSLSMYCNKISASNQVKYRTVIVLMYGTAYFGTLLLKGVGHQMNIVRYGTEWIRVHNETNLDPPHCL
jgi:hypothetical protein